MRKKKEAKWEREKAEIKVGDIFSSALLDKFIVTKVNDRDIYILWSDGSSVYENKSKFDIQYCKKVGHVDLSERFKPIHTGRQQNGYTRYR